MKHDGIWFESCPLCGDDRALEIDKELTFEKFLKRYKDGNFSVRMECFNCGLVLFEHTTEELDYHKRIKLLADKWNRRANVRA